MARFLKWLIGDWWVVRPCGWPYPPGYATYNKWRNTVLDTGLPDRETAQAICDELNNRTKG